MASKPRSSLRPPNEERSVSVCDIFTFCELITDLRNRGPQGYYEHRVSLFEYFNKGQLYVQKTKLKEKGMETWCDDVVPGFCVYNEEESIVFLWTRMDWWHRGIARQFVEYFAVKHVVEVLERSKEFWDIMGVKYDRVV